MNPYVRLSKQHSESPGWTRIDMLLALYDGATDRIRKALAALKENRLADAVPLLAKSQLIVTELAAGVRVEINPDMGENLLRLYEFIVHLLREPKPKELQDALKLLQTLREGFEAIREEAIRMERAGEIAQADSLRTLQATA